MSKNKNPTWKTKYGSRRVRHEPPALVEAIAAAKDITDDRDAQIEIAASLMGISREQAMAEWPKTTLQAKPRMISTVAFTATRSGVERAVVVERKPSRRIVTRKLTSAG